MKKIKKFVWIHTLLFSFRIAIKTSSRCSLKTWISFWLKSEHPIWDTSLGKNLMSLMQTRWWKNFYRLGLGDCVLNSESAFILLLCPSALVLTSFHTCLSLIPTVHQQGSSCWTVFLKMNKPEARNFTEKEILKY